MWETFSHSGLYLISLSSVISPAFGLSIVFLIVLVFPFLDASLFFYSCVCQLLESENLLFI